MPIVYILTNQSMPDTIKIGITDNLEWRIRELDNTSTPLPFECYYAVEVKDASKIEKKIHEGLDDKRIRQNREFFNASPEQAKSILEIAEVMGGKNVTPKNDIVETAQDKEALDRSRRVRKRFNFAMINIPPKTILEFAKDRTITCEVYDESQIKLFVLSAKVMLYVDPLLKVKFNEIYNSLVFSIVFISCCMFK